MTTNTEPVDCDRCGARTLDFQLHPGGTESVSSDWLCPKCRESVVVECPSCKGTGEMFVSGIIYAPGHSGPYARKLPCYRCKGAKVIPAEQLAWIERGERLRAYRVDRLGLGLRKAARRWGISPSVLSEIESGQVNNLDVDIYCPEVKTMDELLSDGGEIFGEYDNPFSWKLT